MLIDPGDAELLAIRSQFCLLVARWRLTQADLSVILGETIGSFPKGRILPDWINANAEQRIRLLVRLDDALRHRSKDGDITAAPREVNLLESGTVPIHLLADLRALRAAIAWAESDDEEPNAREWSWARTPLAPF